MIRHPSLFWAGWLTGLLGLLFYANFRLEPILFDGIAAFQWLQWVEQPIALPRWFSEWIPSFLHVLGMSLFTAGLLGTHQRRWWAIPLAWLAIDLVFEVLQGLPQLGVLGLGHFEWVDIAALCAAALASALLLRPRQPLTQHPGMPKLALWAALGMGSVTMLGSYQESDPGFDYCTYPDGSVDRCVVAPVYLEWEAVRVASPLSLSAENASAETQALIDAGAPVSEFAGLYRPGKIYLYQHLLMVIERGAGVAIFDNTDPAAPRYLGFIDAKGASDVVVRQGVLYITNFVDLLALDLNQLAQPSVTHDLLTYPFDGEKYLPSHAVFGYFTNVDKGDWQPYDIERENGMLVGYRTLSGQEYMFADVLFQGLAIQETVQ